jgi:hypothetical protein
MRRRITVAVLAFACMAAGAPLASGQSPEAKYRALRAEVVKKHGKRAPGRNIVRDGVRTKRGSRPARRADVATSIEVLRRMLVPAPPPAAGPTMASSGLQSQASGSATSPSSGLAACIIQRESGGNTQATNGQYGGIAQWSPDAWRRHGGTQYAPTPQGASYSQQVSVLTHALANGRASEWRPYDGC